jgi:hypothetical protein
VIAVPRVVVDDREVARALRDQRVDQRDRMPDAEAATITVAPSSMPATAASSAETVCRSWHAETEF